MATRRCPDSRRTPKSLRSAVRRAVLGACAISVAALYAAAPAGAVNATVGGNSYGFQPRDAAAPTPTGALTYHGGPVMHSNNTYAIYWDPPTPTAATGSYDGDWHGLIDGFLRDVGRDSGTTGNVYSVISQYTDAGGGRAAYNSTYRGAHTDAQAYPSNGCAVGPTCLTDAQLRTELSSYISANSLPAGMTSIFFLLTPPGVTVCTDASGTDCSSSSSPTSFCSYHSFIGNQSTPGPATVLYAVQPWTAGSAGLDAKWDLSSTPLATDCQDGSNIQEEPNQTGLDLDGDYDVGLADLIINQMSIEQIDTITNPLMNGWYDAANSTEQSDQCRDAFLIPGTPVPTPPPDPSTGAGTLSNQSINGGAYYLQKQFNLDALKLDYPGIPCQHLLRLAAAFTVPAAVNPGDIVGFDGSESLVDLGPGSYSWDFGDGSTAVTGPSVSHAFTTPGTYTVTLTITDKGANVTTAQRQVTVNGSTAGSGTPPGTGGTDTGTTSGTTSATTSGAATTTTANSSTAGGSAAGSTPGATSTPVPSAAQAKAPVAAEHILSRSLKGARRSGVTVSYRVDQAVAGRFQIMIDAATAKRLHIKGARVAGGASAQGSAVVIGSAILVTLKGGGSKLAIHFTKSAASHLGHARSLPITVKMTVASDNGRRSVMDAATTLR
jgi:hypothetical protein